MTLGPISAALEAELRQQVQRNGIVIWLDRDGHYTPLVDQLRALRGDGALPYEVHGFCGSHLALMLLLDAVAASSYPPLLLIHLLGFTEDTVTQTSALALNRSGVRCRKGLATLIREAAADKVPTETIAAYLATEPETLAMADTWLEAQLQADGGGLYEQVRSTPAADARDQDLRAMEAVIAMPPSWDVQLFNRPRASAALPDTPSDDHGNVPIVWPGLRITPKQPWLRWRRKRSAAWAGATTGRWSVRCASSKPASGRCSPRGWWPWSNCSQTGRVSCSRWRLPLKLKAEPWWASGACRGGCLLGLFTASGASQPGSMEERGAPSC